MDYVKEFSNKIASFMTNYRTFVLDCLSPVGEHPWIALFVTYALLYIHYNYLLPVWEDYNDKKRNDEILKKTREKMKMVRLKLQEKHDEEVKRNLELQKEKEEAKKLELAEKMVELVDSDLKGGTRLGGKVDDSPKKNVRLEYNPLLGPSRFPSYRPPRRSCCRGGGCG